MTGWVRNRNQFELSKELYLRRQAARRRRARLSTQETTMTRTAKPTQGVTRGA